MTEPQFARDVILIQAYALAMGPFTFDLSGQLPTGDDIATVTVIAYLGKRVTTTDLISGTPTVAANVVSLYLKYPGTTKHGLHKLTFQYTLASGAKDEADFLGVMVTDV